MKPKVYLETSFISYLTGRLSSDLTSLQRQLSSQRWWTAERGRFDLLISQPVYDECGRGDELAARDRLSLIADIPLLPLNKQIMEIAQQLLSPEAFPQKAETDAIHLAVATAYGCEYVLTWNFKHINNARIKRAATFIIQSHGYEPPTICTPDELMGFDSEQG